MLAQGRRKKRELPTTPATYTDMSVVEQDTITCLIDAFAVVNDCCHTQVCNGSNIETIADHVGQQNAKLRAAGLSMSLAYIDGQQYFFDMVKQLETECTNTTIPAWALTTSVTNMMTDVFIFLETRLKCFPEDERLNTPEEQERLNEIQDEVAKIKPYLYTSSSDASFKFIQRKLRGLLQEAKGQLETKDNFKGEENTKDVILGCMCIIISPVDKQFSSVQEDTCSDLTEENVQDMVQHVTVSYSMNKKGFEVDEKALQATYLGLEMASDCGKISQQQHDRFLVILKQHHVYV